MSRLTEKKFLDNFKEIKNINPNYVASKEELMYEKLGKLEDLEEQLGCPLKVVVKALKDGIYTLDLPREDLIKQVDLKLSNRETEWYLINNIMCVNLKDYKISFWLKEDKSE